MYEWQRMDWKRMREMHSDEDNVDEWEWKWKEREMQNGLEIGKRRMVNGVAKEENRKR